MRVCVSVCEWMSVCVCEWMSVCVWICSYWFACVSIRVCVCVCERECV